MPITNSRGGEVGTVATHVQNVYGEMCPAPLVKAEKKLGEMEPGDVLIMESDHACTTRLLREFLRKLPCRFSVEEVSFGIWRFTIEKR